MQHSHSYSISLLCKTLSVSRASFYHYFYYSNSNDIKAFILSRILTIFYNSNSTYGSPRIAAVLNEEGFNISIKTVSKYMRILNISSIHNSLYPKINNRMREEEKSLIINLIKDIDIIRPNQVWVTDITYIKTINDGFVYLSSIIDLFSRKVIAWNVSLHMRKEFVMDTLLMAFKARNYPRGVIVHSDKASQYRSSAFRSLIASFHSLYSYTSLNHSCDENATQESFHASIKKEHLNRCTLYNIHDVQREVFSYIEGFYNSRRIHSSLGFKSPNSFEEYFYLHIPLLSMSNLLT